MNLTCRHWISIQRYVTGKAGPEERRLRDLKRRFDIQIKGVEVNLMNSLITGAFQYADQNEILSVVTAAMDLGFRSQVPRWNSVTLKRK